MYDDVLLGGQYVITSELKTYLTVQVRWVFEFLEDPSNNNCKLKVCSKK